jgi:GT2 family glycosyltransferase
MTAENRHNNGVQPSAASPVTSPPVDIVIPFFSEVSIVASLLNSLEHCAAELRALRCSILLVDDSGASARSSDSLLDAALQRLRSIVPCEQVRNNENIGFVRSANIGLKRAISAEHDCLLLNTDTVVFPGALTEVQAVAYSDGGIGFVNPRSNNATICSLPHQDRDSPVTPDAAFAAYALLAPRLPRLQFVPTCVGFCMYVKHEVLASIGVFDEVYGRGYNEENDLAMRGNRAGYCAVIANRAFVYHRGGASFGDEAQRLERQNAAILDARYPEYRPAVNSYYASPPYKAEMLMYGLPQRHGSRPTLALLPSRGIEDGEVLEALRQRYEMHVVHDPVGETRLFAAVAAIDPAMDTVRAAARLGPVNALVLTDTSRFDRLDTRDEAEQTWRLMARHADVVVAAKPGHFETRLGIEAAGEVNVLPDEIENALSRVTVARVAERLAAVAQGCPPGHAVEQSSLLSLVETQRKRIDELERSVSWRVTSPVRSIFRMLTNVFGSSRGG